MSPNDHSTTGSRSSALSRRTFLHGAGLGGLLVGLSPLLASTASATPTRTVRDSAAVRHGRAKLVTVLQTADIHGQLETHDEFFWENDGPVFRRTGGMARIQTLVDRVRCENPAGTLLVDGGDCFQGSGYVALSKGEVMVPLVRQLEYDAVVPGNWEVVYGKDQLLKVMAGYRTPVVCSNMYDKDGDVRGDYLFEPVHVIDVAGVRIGFLSFNDPTVPIRQDPSYSVGIDFGFPEENAAAWVKHLREERRCDVVMAMTHMGIAQQVNMASLDYMQGVDVILGADTHERIRTPIEGKYATVTEPGAFGSFVGRMDLVVEKGKIKDSCYELMEVAEDEYPEDRRMRTVLDKVKAPYAKELDAVLGTAAGPIFRYYVLETPMDNMLTDALREAVDELLAPAGQKLDVALSNGFRFCPPLVPAEGKTADITLDYLWSMLPVDSPARIGNVKGSLVKPWLEKELNNALSPDPLKRFGGWVVRMSGMTVNFTLNGGTGPKVNAVTIGGQPLDETREYLFGACERTDPPDVLCRIKGVTNARSLDFTLHDAVRAYLARHPGVAPKQEGRVTATDLSATLLGQLPGTDYGFR